ncbi:MAG: CDP-glycerol glycerophosphotransferase family protein, partial [Peptostreptococcaceae bacterium]
SILQKPMIFYTYDYENYRDNLRGFYFDMFDEVPGTQVYDTDELIHSIKNIEDCIDKKYKRFRDKYNSLEDGNSSKRCVDKIKELLV